MIKSESGTDQSSHFGGGLLENIRCVRAAIAQLVEGLVPETHKYVLWAAETGTGLYRKAADGREEGEEQKKFVIDNSGKTAKLVIKIKEEVGRKASADTESLITELQLSDEVLDELYQTRSAVRVLSQNIQANVSKLFEHSNSIIKEVCALDKLLGERVFGRMTPEAAAKFAKWVEKKKGPAKMSEFTRLVVGKEKTACEDGGAECGALPVTSGSPVKRPKIF